MKSKIFDHVSLRILLGVLLVWSFLSIYLIVGAGSGRIWSLVTIGPRSTWRIAQGFAWFGVGAEFVALLVGTSVRWRKVAYFGASSLVISAIVFVARSDDLKYFGVHMIEGSIFVFCACAALRAAQLRMKSQLLTPDCASYKTGSRLVGPHQGLNK